MKLLLVKSAVPIWLLAVVGVVLVGLFSPHDLYLTFLPVVLGTATILTFIVQLAFTGPAGFVDRCAASIAGALVILAAGTLVFAPLGIA
jgi:hypothetical protein